MDGKNSSETLNRLLERLEKVLAASALVSSLRKLVHSQARLQDGRPVTPGERATLEAQGNVCADWSRVRCLPDADWASVRNNVLAGDIFLSGFTGECTGSDGRRWAAGMVDCRVRDAVIGNACLYRVSRLERQIIEAGAMLVDVGIVDCSAPTLFSLGRIFHPGTESGARGAWMWDGFTLSDYMDAISLPAEAQKAFQQKVDAELKALPSHFGYVGSGAEVLQTRHLHGVWVGPGSTVSGASLLRESALLSTLDQPCNVLEDGCIEHSLLQAGACVGGGGGGGKVSESVLFTGARVDWGGRVNSSVIGPGTEVSKGEIQVSIVGPHVGFHHQALLISALWPEGGGNIAYGAMVGSNHTGRKPDQEIRPGEGNFFGLGCSIKFPANFSAAPYSLFAAGIIALPQRLACPFSLITQPLTSIPAMSPGLNEIIPGWMWSDNAYALVRRSYKLSGGFLNSRLFDPSLARLVLSALQALRTIPANLDYYMEEHAPSLGKNFLQSENLSRSLAAYVDYLWFFLMVIHTDSLAESAAVEMKKANTAQDKETVAAIKTELGAIGNAQIFLAVQKHRLSAFKSSILACLVKEDKRGRRIFDDYAEFHTSAVADPIYVRLEVEIESLSRRLDAFCSTSGG